MTEKELGHIELEWICPNCTTRNKGTVTTCIGCGAAQPPDVQFVQPLQTELINDSASIARAKAGPDIHCAFCGARNPAGAKVCANCGADLVEGKARQAGKVVGAFKETPEAKVTCPACGESNPALNQRCSRCGAPLGQAQTAAPAAEPAPAQPARKINRWALIAVIVVAAVCIIAVLAMLLRTQEAGSTVTERAWKRVVLVEQFGPEQHSDWRSELPAGAKVGSCSERYRYTSEQPVAGAREVCGTPYTVDEGTGYGKVVQECQYEVYEDYCSYEINDWSVVDQAVLQGSDNAPSWPNPQLAGNQRLGDRQETYQIIFESGGKTYTYSTSDENLYRQAVIGSSWTLTLNGLGEIVNLQPSQ